MSSVARFLITVILVGLPLSLIARADIHWPRTTVSADGVSIAYEVHGAGEPTLVFIHGWSCDSRYWRAQTEHFSRSHRVITIDLAGHGHSGMQREIYSMAAFGADVRAVLQAEQVDRAVLIGHSMGGAVILAAALDMPERIAAIIGVDTFQDLGQTLSPEEVEAWVAPLRADFLGNVQPFVAGMFVDRTDAALRDWIIADMSSAPPEVAVSAMEQLFQSSGNTDTLATLRDSEIPIFTINADLWPTAVEANRELLPGFEAVILSGTDHFLHMAEPETFNQELARVLQSL
ncbi:MAG: alpha/beta fold hydrolase [Wenzhouxiangella sp.]